MTDKPTLFMPAMVRALIAGTKRQTRRVLKPQPDGRCGGFRKVFKAKPFFEALDHDGAPYSAFAKGRDFVTPYPPIAHDIGDRLWVRESWRTWPVYDPHCASDLTAGTLVRYEATPESPNLGYTPGKLRPSLFMPRWASRLTCMVTDVRVQRIQDISEEDARAEGVERPILPRWPAHPYRAAFSDLWDSINAAPAPRHGPRDAEGRKVISHYESYPWAGGTRVETHRGKPHYIWGNPWVVAYGLDVRLGNIDSDGSGS